MDSESAASACLTDLTTITLGDHNCNVNRRLEDVKLLRNFEDVLPKFSEEHGLHFELKDRKTGNAIIVPLSSNVIKWTVIKGKERMSETEYMQALLKKKYSHVAYLLGQTYAKGFEKPSAVQALTIMELIQGYDATIQFKSGTGKTFSCTFSCAFNVDSEDIHLQVIIITSSHEVAMQFYSEIRHLLPQEISVALCIGCKKNNTVRGGFKTTSSLMTKTKSLREQIEEAKTAQVIVGTMGKIYDFICNKKCINTNYCKTICVDEFDNIFLPRSRGRSSMDMNTDEQIMEILSILPKDTQKIFFSATVSEEALSKSMKFYRDPEDDNCGSNDPFVILLPRDDFTLEGIKQYYVICDSLSYKYKILQIIIQSCRIIKCIIFCNTISTAQGVQGVLRKMDVAAPVFHGSLSSEEREKIHKDMIDGRFRILISTDLSARGLDIQGINLVFNFDMPNDLETYVHRVGRSGRYGKKGTAISLIMCNDHINEESDIDYINECSKNNPMIELKSSMDLEELL